MPKENLPIMFYVAVVLVAGVPIGTAIFAYFFAELEKNCIGNLKKKHSDWRGTLQRAVTNINVSKNIVELVKSIGELRIIFNSYSGYAFLASDSSRVGDFVNILDEQYARMNSFGSKIWNKIWNSNKKLEALKTGIINRVSEVSNKSWERSEEKINGHLKKMKAIWAIWAILNVFLFLMPCYLLCNYFCLSQKSVIINGYGLHYIFLQCYIVIIGVIAIYLFMKNTVNLNDKPFIFCVN
jgi:hypothetical protein